ncbi:MAG: hypothetical protein ACI86M_002662 [Saprospiraceae bacterium]|jgi:hypothetical protein
MILKVNVVSKLSILKYMDNVTRPLTISLMPFLLLYDTDKYGKRMACLANARYTDMREMACEENTCKKAFLSKRS